MRWKGLATALIIGLSLSGCSAFVPSWNAQPTPIEIDNENDSPDVNESEPETEPEPVPVEPETDPEPEQTEEEPEPVERSEVNVEVMDARVDLDRGELVVIALVQDFVEDGGECSLKLLAGDFSTEMTVGSERSSNYTACSAFEIPLSGLPGGTAVVSVSYFSDSYEGESEPVSVVIP